MGSVGPSVTRSVASATRCPGSCPASWARSPPHCATWLRSCPGESSASRSRSGSRWPEAGCCCAAPDQDGGYTPQPSHARGDPRRMTDYDVEALRAEFPALALEQHGRPAAYFDGPGGTQVSQRVIDAVTRYYLTSNANDGGAFLTSERSDAVVAEARGAVADLLGAASPDEIKFGYNMTTLTFHISRSIGATLAPRDEIVVTTLDHEANVSPWRRLADDRGLVVRTVDIHPDDATLDLDSLDAVLGPRTKLVAVGLASNSVGTINPVREIAARARAVGALTYVDAVHYVPHGPVDVRALGADFLVTSAYKWFGPHLGALYGRADVLDALPAYKVRPAHDRFQTGTQNFEGIAGTLAAVDYLRSVGRRYGGGAADAGEGGRGDCGGNGRNPGLRADAGRRAHPRPDCAPRRPRPRHGRAEPSGGADADRGRDHRRRLAARGGAGARPPGHLRLGWRLLRPGADRAIGSLRDGRRPAARHRPLQHRRRGRSAARGVGGNRRRPRRPGGGRLSNEARRRPGGMERRRGNQHAPHRAAAHPASRGRRRGGNSAVRRALPLDGPAQRRAPSQHRADIGRAHVSTPATATS